MNKNKAELIAPCISANKRGKENHSASRFKLLDDLHHR